MAARTTVDEWCAFVDETSSSVKHWVAFAGGVLVIVVLYWAQAVLVPIALAALLSFVLAPPVSWLERWLGRVPAVLAVVTLVFIVLGTAGWGLVRQMNHLSEDLPGYRVNILAKIADVRGAGKGGAVEKLQETIEDIKIDLGKSDPAKGPAPRSVVVASQPVAGFPAIAWLGPIVGPLGTAALVVALVIFMLLERRDLRNRLIGLVGHGRLTVTTKAFDEAGTRVSRQLLMQSLVNAVYGIVAGFGLFFLGVPYPLVWGVLGAALRFIPYVGPVLGAGAPIAVSLAALPGWVDPLWVVAMFVVLELFTNLVLETALYAGTAGVSQVALLISVAFWTWLWGPLGLLMATPLTVCLVVLGKHVPGLEFVGTLIADTPALAPEYGYYQRLLARDPSEAADLIERHIKTGSADTVYDALLLPALNYAERDRIERRLSVEEEAGVIEATRELLAEAAESIRRLSPAPASPEASPPLAPLEPLRVLGYAANGVADELALVMLGHLLTGRSVVVEITPERMLAADLVSLVHAQGVSIVCLADLPPSPASKTRYLVKRLRAALPDVRIVVGRWAPPALADESTQVLREAGATLVSSTLTETRDYLAGLVELPRPGEVAIEAA
ncbi:MAG: AI-2E family transporter [Acidobacteriota bacterium]|nr:AI-2E family transporter [Acidobacteriota bacterium]